MESSCLFDDVKSLESEYGFSLTDTSLYECLLLLPKSVRNSIFRKNSIEIYSNTKFLVNGERVQNRAYCYVNGYDSYPRCANCDKFVKFRTFEIGYRKTCSVECKDAYLAATDSSGDSIRRKSARKAVETKNSTVMEDGRTLMEHTVEKINLSRNMVGDDGLTSNERIAVKISEYHQLSKTIIDDNGKSKFDNRFDKVSVSLSTIGDDGLSPAQRGAIKGRKTKSSINPETGLTIAQSTAIKSADTVRNTIMSDGRRKLDHMIENAVKMKTTTICDNGLTISQNIAIRGANTKKSLIDDASGMTIKDLADIKISMAFLGDAYYKLIDYSYMSKSSVCEISEELGLDRHTVSKYMKKLGIKINPRPISKQESSLLKFIESIIPDVEIITNTTGYIKRGEVDIIIPEYGLGIEYNGLYWHSEQRGRDCSYHLGKTIECQKVGISLIHIFESEWLHRRDVVESFLCRLFGRCLVISDSDVDVELCSKSDMCGLYSNNSFYGNMCGDINLVGSYKGDIVCGMSLDCDESEYEIVGMFIKNGIDIDNKYDKLLKYFICEYSPAIIRCHSDYRYGIDNFFDSFGFRYVGMGAPRPWYASKDRELLYKEHVDIENPLIVWDCGTLEYVWHGEYNFEEIAIENWDKIKEFEIPSTFGKEESADMDSEVIDKE